MKIPDTFKAFYVEENSGTYKGSIKNLAYQILPNNEVSIQVNYSSINYKDALSASGLNKVTRSYPHIPGIDAAGIIIEDKTGKFKTGQKVIVTGYDFGTNTFGGFAEIIRVPSEWVVPLPDGLSLEQSMIFGTAGFTAIYGIKRLQRELIFPDSGKILVTGATGGVGSLAVLGLSQNGYEVVAATRKIDSISFLKHLGATEVVDTSTILNDNHSPLLTRKWAGSIETVGGNLLDSVLRQTNEKGAVACCGNILGRELTTNVYPFILRGISLLGIDSAICTQPLRTQIWEAISKLDIACLPANYYKIICLDEIPSGINQILQGKQKGRIVIKYG